MDSICASLFYFVAGAWCSEPRKMGCLFRVGGFGCVAGVLMDAWGFCFLGGIVTQNLWWVSKILEIGMSRSSKQRDWPTLNSFWGC